jgi:predicted nucleotidyltransferase
VQRDPACGPLRDEASALGFTLDRLVAFLQPDEIWLFGSRATGQHRPGSDFDILVVLPDSVGEERLAMRRASESMIALAREEIAAAKALRLSLPRQAAFHLAQAEKVIDALLAAEGIISPGAVYRLGPLAALPPVVHVWRRYLIALGKLASAATRRRYVTVSGDLPPTPDPGVLAQDIAGIEWILPELEARYRKPRGAPWL